MLSKVYSFKEDVKGIIIRGKLQVKSVDGVALEISSALKAIFVKLIEDSAEAIYWQIRTLSKFPLYS